MTEYERLEDEIVTLLAHGMHQRFSELIDQISEADPMQVVKWVILSQTPFDELGAIEKICYLKMAMIELNKIRPLFLSYCAMQSPIV